MAATTITGSITFDVWDYATVDGGGYAVIYRAGLCSKPKLASAGLFISRERVTAATVDVAVARYQKRWTTACPVVRCDCGCLAGTTGVDRPVFTDGQPVTYHGSLTNLHGLAYYCGPCCCPNDDCTGAELETPFGQVINHVRTGSYSPVSA